MSCFTRTTTSEDIVSALQGVSVGWPNTWGHTQRLHFLERASRTVNRMSHHGCMGSAELFFFFFPEWLVESCSVGIPLCLPPKKRKGTPILQIPNCQQMVGRSQRWHPVCVCWVWFSEIGQICSGQPASGWTTLSPEHYSVWAQVILV